MNSFTFLLVLTVTLAAGLPHAVRAEAVFFVARTGRDTWSGRLPEPNAEQTDGPFATLIRARTEVRKLKAAGPLSGGATVFVRGGTYTLTEPFTLTDEDSGSAAGPVVYRAFGGEKPTLVGALPVTGFKRWRGHILRCDLTGTPLADVVFQQLFFAGKRMQMARYPNVDPKDPHYGTWAHVVRPAVSGARDRFVCTSDVLKNWTHVTWAEVCIHPSYGWAWNIVPVKSADRERAVITLARNVSYQLRVGDRYYVRNLLEELDAPGEWYLDREAHVLYFRPPADLATGTVLAPVTSTLVRLTAAKYLTLRGFTLEACEGDAVQIHDCEHCVVAQSTIRNCGGWGVSIRGGNHSGARGNDISATGAGGVALDGGDRNTLTRADNFADNNYIHHFAVFRRTYNTGVNVRGVGNTASHNLIHDCPHQGILLGGNDNLVEYNLIHHTNLGSEDTGGLYMSSRNYTMRGNVIRYNVFHHIGGFGKANSWHPVKNGRVKFEYPHFTWGVYLDAPESGDRVYGNLFYSVPVCAMFNHQGNDNTWENNIVVDCPAFQASGGGYPDLAEQSFSYLRKFRQQGVLPLYLRRYPELAAYHDDKTDSCSMSGTRFIRNIIFYTRHGGRIMRERNQKTWGGGQLVWTWRGRKLDFPKFEFDYNCLFAPRDLPLKFSLTTTPDPGKLLTWEQWRAMGKDPHSILADPLFVDAAHHDYRLKPGSPALKLGFKPLPLDHVGPYKDDLRASWPLVEAPGAAALGDFTTERYFVLPGYEPIKAQTLAPRLGLKRFVDRIGTGKPVTVACFAGGRHAQGGWFNEFIHLLRQQYPKAALTPVLADIDGGARGSSFSIYRFRRDVLSHHPDLVFVDFAADDAEADEEAAGKAIEGVVRQAWRTNPRIDLVFVYAFRLGYEKDYARGLCPGAVAAHERVARHYGIPSINLGVRVADMARTGKLKLRSPAPRVKTSPVPVFTLDGVYTSPAANALYAQMVSEAFIQLAGAGKSDPLPARLAALQHPLHPDNLQRACLVPIVRSMLSGEWKREAPGPFARHFDELWVTRTPGAKLTFRFKGTAAGIFDLMGPDTGRVRVRIDGRDRGVRQQVDRWCYRQRLSALPLARGLEDKDHTVTVELLPGAPDRTEPIAEAKRLGRYKPEMFVGVALRLGWIRLLGEPGVSGAAVR